MGASKRRCLERSKSTFPTNVINAHVHTHTRTRTPRVHLWSPRCSACCDGDWMIPRSSLPAGKFPCPSEEELADLQSQLDAQKATLEIVTPELALLSSENDALIGQLSGESVPSYDVLEKAAEAPSEVTVTSLEPNLGLAHKSLCPPLCQMPISHRPQSRANPALRSSRPGSRRAASRKESMSPSSARMKILLISTRFFSLSVAGTVFPPSHSFSSPPRPCPPPPHIHSPSFMMA